MRIGVRSCTGLGTIKEFKAKSVPAYMLNAMTRSVFLRKERPEENVMLNICLHN